MKWDRMNGEGKIYKHYKYKSIATRTTQTDKLNPLRLCTLIIPIVFLLRLELEVDAGRGGESKQEEVDGVRVRAKKRGWTGFLSGVLWTAGIAIGTGNDRVRSVSARPSEWATSRSHRLRAGSSALRERKDVQCSEASRRSAAQ
jgi:hypothetical protein